jgi:internalin A
MSELALKLIAENKITEDPFLDLGNCGLVNYLPDELSDCVWLERLNLGAYYYDKVNRKWIGTNNGGNINSFTREGLSVLEKLIVLQSLDISDNRISDIRFLEKLSSLESLDLSNNRISDIRFLEELSSLKSLNLSDNQISDIRFLEKLSGLKSLNLSNNQISDIRFLEKLSSLESIDLSNNLISDYQCLKRLKYLEYLDLSINKIEKIQFISTSKRLAVLNDNFIDHIDLEDYLRVYSFNVLQKDLLSIISYLKNIVVKKQEYENAAKINDIEKLLKENIYVGIKSLQWIHHFFLIEYFENMNISYPPIEIIQKGEAEIIRYLEKIDTEGTDYIYESKLTLVGDGGAGKTSLQERIIDKNAPLPKNEERTRGIKISNWNFKDKEDKNYTVNIWDFGGQDVYYPVHRFFLTENSVYVLMASTRIQTHNFEYWIPTIYQFGGNSPIILVQTCHDNNKSHWNDLGVFYGNPNFKILKPHFELNLPNNNEGLSVLENAIEQQIIQLPHIGKPVPKSWVKVREALAEIQKGDACISYEKFIEICQTVDAQNFQKNSDIELLGRFFADLGIILWYHDKDYLKDWVILQPQWAMLAVYKIIDDVEVQKCGIIRKNDFIRLWSEEVFLQKQELLKNMIQVFKIAFPKKHSKEDFILPARLNSLPEEKRWTNIDKTIRLEYTFEFMPRGIVNQLSAELSRQIKSDSDVWNNAVNFGLNGSEAQVEEDYFKRNLYIKANGQDARGLVVLIMESIENILEDYKGVKPTKNVPCNCPTCQKSETPELFSYSKLIEWSNTKNTVVCNAGLSGSTELSIQNLLYSVGLNVPFVTSMKDLAISEKNIDEIIIGKDSVIPIITTGPGGTKITSDSEMTKELNTRRKREEDRSIKKWKNNAIITLTICLFITLGGLYVYANELGNFDWKALKEGDSFKWIGIGVMTILNGFPIKMMYDRFLDDTKEKGFRENLRNKG